MAIVHIQTNGASGEVTSAPLAFASNVTAGNKIIALVLSVNQNLSSVTDSQGNTYTQLCSAYDGAYTVFMATASQTGACMVTFTQSTSGFMAVGIMEYSGIGELVDYDITAFDVTPTTTPESGVVTLTAPGSVIISAVLLYNVGTTIEPRGGETERFQMDSPTVGWYQIQSEIPGSTGDKTAQWTLGAPDVHDAIALVFSPASASVGSSQCIFIM
jgi:hypothetical protein